MPQTVFADDTPNWKIKIEKKISTKVEETRQIYPY